MGKKSYLIYGYMFATLFKFTGVAYKKDLVFLYFFFSKKFSSHVGYPPSGAKKW